MSPLFIVLVMIALVFSGMVYIMISCEDSTRSVCENVTQAKLDAMPHQSPWSAFWSQWEWSG